MKNLPSYDEFINESLVVLTLNKTMKNEFMNDFILKQDFETAKRLFFMNGSIMLTHIEEDRFELRTYSNVKGEELDNIIKDRINPNMTRMVFSRFGKIKTDKIKEKICVAKVKLLDTK